MESLQSGQQHKLVQEKIYSAITWLLNPGIEEPYPGKQWDVLIERWCLVFAIFYLEVIFKMSTTGKYFPSLFVILLFSIAIGQFLYLLASIAKSSKLNTILKAVFLGILGLIFTIEYFVYRQFNDLYSVKTVVAGAGGVATGFMGDVLHMVFSLSGLGHILLFFLPLFIYLLQAYFAIDQALDIPILEKGRIALVVVIAHLLALFIINIAGGFSLAYSSQYHFQTAAPNYGLLTAMRLDITRSEDMSFYIEEEKDNTSPDAIVQYGEKAVMDIDFNDLAENTWDETYQNIDHYIASLTPSSKNSMTGFFEGYNLIIISAEAFSHKAMDPKLTPTLWRMYTKGIIFTDYYQFESAGTTGGECQNLFGVIPADGGESFKETAYNNNYFTMGNILNRLGYNGWAFHNNTYTFYDRNLTHINLGYNNGFMGYGNGMEEYVTQQWPQSDYEMIKGTFDNIYWDQEPFNVYYMSVSGHSGYSQYGNAMTEKNWPAVEKWAQDNNVSYNDEILGYLAANLELEYAMEYLVGQLEEKNMARHTLIVLTADHFPYGLDEGSDMGGGNLAELYDTKIENYFDRDRNALIMWSASLEDKDPIVVRDPTCSLDILPTLCNLFDVEWDSRLLPGRDVFSEAEPLIFNPAYYWETREGRCMDGAFVPNENSTLENTSAYQEKYDKIVANKINYCFAVLEHNYYGHLFGEQDDVNYTHDNATEIGKQLHEAAVARTAQTNQETAEGDTSSEEDAA